MNDTRDTSSRKWQLTINNPIEQGWSHEAIKKALSTFSTVIYWCLCDEIGFEGTYHTHVYIHCRSGLRFSTLGNAFPKTHREMCKGTALQNRDYVRKEGKYLNSEKSTTNLKDTFEEWGEIPLERQGQRNDLTDLYDMVKSGMSDYEILEQNPTYLLNIEKLEKVRQTVKYEEFKDKWRDIEVNYIWGVTGTGKTRTVMEKYGYSNVYRVTDYDHPFDAYKGQDVIVFEEFCSSLKIDDMLKYLDGYPVEFPARYMNKQACFTKVYLLTNIDLRCQYRYVQDESKATWQAFLRRIHNVTVYYDVGKSETYSTGQYISEVFPVFAKTPFDTEEKMLFRTVEKQERYVQENLDLL